MKIFDKLPKDILLLIVTDLDINSISNFCSIYSRLDNYLSTSSIFWKNRIKEEYSKMNIENVINFKELYKWLIELDSQEYFNLLEGYMKQISENVKFKDRDKFEGDVYTSSVIGYYQEIYNVIIYSDLNKRNFNDIIKKWEKRRDKSMFGWLYIGTIFIRIDE